jgi:hypothetical protein
MPKTFYAETIEGLVGTPKPLKMINYINWENGWNYNTPIIRHYNIRACCIITHSILLVGIIKKKRQQQFKIHYCLTMWFIFIIFFY